MRRALALLVPCLAALPAGAQARVPLSVVQDDAQLLRLGAPARERALDDWQALGADVVRVLVVWRDAERDPLYLPALDAAVAGALARGLEPLLTPTTPGPVAASRCRPRAATCDPDPDRFAAFVMQLARRYPAVRRWSVLNEPNNPNWLTPQQSARGPRSPAIYRGLVRVTARALAAAGRSGDLLLAGEAAPMGAHRSRPPARRPVHPAAFLRALLAGDRRLPVDAVAHHPYSRGGVAAPLDPAGARDLTLAGLGRLRAIVRDAERRGVLRARTPIWLTEQGFQTNPPDRVFGVAPDLQARYVNEAERAAGRTPGIAALAQYLLVDERDLSRFQSGLRFANGRRKPAFAAYRTPLVISRIGGRLAIWGRLRPVRRAGVAVGIERRGRRVATTRTLAGGEVRARLRAAPGSLRLVWRDARGRTYRSRAADP